MGSEFIMARRTCHGPSELRQRTAHERTHRQQAPSHFHPLLTTENNNKQRSLSSLTDYSGAKQNLDVLTANDTINVNQWLTEKQNAHWSPMSLDNFW